jgi:hypothetical protein
MKKIYGIFVDDGSYHGCVALNHYKEWENEEGYFLEKSAAERQLEKMKNQNAGLDFFIDELYLCETR